MGSVMTDRETEIALAGSIGLGAVILLAVLLALHPFGTTGLYDDGERFLDHVNVFWVVIHLLGSVVFLAFPTMISTWARNLDGVAASYFGRWATHAALIGMGVGVLHLLATDTMTFVAFADTFDAGDGSEAVSVGADLLLRIHAATLTAWVIGFFFAVPALAGIAAHRDGRFPAWYSWLAWAAAALALASVIVTFAEGQWTTFSEMGLFRSGATLAALWIGFTAWWMRRGSITPSA